MYAARPLSACGPRVTTSITYSPDLAGCARRHGALNAMFWKRLTISRLRYPEDAKYGGVPVL
jgi:hypothetical protein